MNKKPKYSHLTFKSEKKFQNWLNRVTHKKIEFFERGHDLIMMWIAESGEILHCNAHSRLYNGKFINLEHFEVNKHIEIWDNKEKKYIPYANLVVEQIDTQCQIPA